jgi:hypothetical protein
MITSNGGGPTASVHVNVGLTAVTTVTATGTPLIIFTISGGADQALFTINANTGVLTFRVSAIAGTYVVTVSAVNAIREISQTITVTVS